MSTQYRPYASPSQPLPLPLPAPHQQAQIHPQARGYPQQPYDQAHPQYIHPQYQTQQQAPQPYYQSQPQHQSQSQSQHPSQARQTQQQQLYPSHQYPQPHPQPQTETQTQSHYLPSHTHTNPQAAVNANARAQTKALARAQAEAQAQAHLSAQGAIEAVADAHAQWERDDDDLELQEVVDGGELIDGLGDNGFDMDTGGAQELVFNVSEHYVVEALIGEGAYGHVASAVHVHSGTRVAIKRICPFNHSMFSQRTLREIKLLRHFKHENIISILDIIAPPAYEDFHEVYLVQELMETDLHRVIKTQALSDDHCQYFLYQAIRGLKALHSADVLHRDLKPSNLLLNANCDLKICDFGLARSAAAPPPDAGPNGGNGFMTEYVATRWYRAPEVMLSFQEYTKAIDMWSIGCILGEMINGEPMFPGKDYAHQLNLTLDVVGTPNMDDFNEITSPQSKDYIRTLPLTRKKDLRTVCPEGSPKAIDFLKRCLTFSPSKRMTVDEALTHIYMEPYHDPADEPGAEPLKPEFFNFTIPQRKDKKDDPRIREFMKRLTYAEILKPIE